MKSLKSITRNGIELRQTACQEVYHSTNLFKVEFINDLLDELYNSQLTKDEIPLWKIGFEQEWLGIFNFFIKPLISKVYLGMKEVQGISKY